MIVLSVLKIIGLILAAVIAAAVLLLLMLLFCPVRYRVRIEGKNTEMAAAASAKWLFGLGGAKISYKDKIVSYKAGFLGINLIREKKETEEETVKEAKTEKEAEAVIEAQKEGEESIGISILLDRINKKTKELLDKLKRIRDKIKLIKYIWEAPVTKRALRVCKVRIFNLLNHIKPYIIKGSITLGLTDASSTAFVYGICGCLCQTVGINEITLVPDFENEGVIADSITMRGRVFIYYIVWQALRVVLNRDVQRVVRKVRRSF